MSLHWPDVAKRWHWVGPPLRPSPEDIEYCTDAVNGWARASDEPPRALILGVTPEIYRLPWPPGSDVCAVDHTQAMIDGVWPGPREAARCAEWTELPLASASRDLAFCDGGVHLLDYPNGQARLAQELARVLVPGGLVVLRLFVPPSLPETSSSVLRDLLEGKIGSVNLLKLRLWTSLQGSPVDGIELAEVYRTLSRVAPDLPALARKLGWDVEHLLAIETYRDSTIRYYIVSEPVVVEAFEKAGFELMSSRRPSYELGERCPTLLLRRRSA